MKRIFMTWHNDLRSSVLRNRGRDLWKTYCTSTDPYPEVEFSSSTSGNVKRESVKTILNTKASGDQVRIQGWVRTFRKQKHTTFLDVNDGSTYHRIPVVIPAKFVPKELGMHASVDITGVLTPSPKNAALVEIHITEPIKVVGPCDQKTYPFGGKIRYEDEYIRNYLHLRAKTNRFGSLFRLRSNATRAIQDYFHRNDFVQIQTPILTSNDCEGAGEVFLVRPANENLMLEQPISKSERTISPVKIGPVQTHDHKDLPFDGQKHTHRHKCDACDKELEHTHTRKAAHISKSYNNHFCDDHAHMRQDSKKLFNPDESFFDCKAYLTVSSQLHLEAMANGLDKVWTMSPVFRSENAQSTRHLAEFYMVEAELAFAYDISHILEPMEELVKDVVRAISYDSTYEFNTFSESNEELRGTLDSILKNPFTVMTFQEAKDLLASKANSIVPPGRGLNREQELILVEKLNGGVPVFVIDWPANIKPFYMRELPDNPSLCSAVDLLVPGVGELCGGSLREPRIEVLESRMKALDPTGNLQTSLEWYLDLRRFGSVPTGGFGLGFDRLMQLVTGIKNIKDVTAFPRWAHNCPM